MWMGRNKPSEKPLYVFRCGDFRMGPAIKASKLQLSYLVTSGITQSLRSTHLRALSSPPHTQRRALWIVSLWSERISHSWYQRTRHLASLQGLSEPERSASGREGHAHNSRARLGRLLRFLGGRVTLPWCTPKPRATVSNLNSEDKDQKLTLMDKKESWQDRHVSLS